jgi:hypothetical protein
MQSQIKTDWGGLAMHLLCEVGRSAECTALAAARLKASGMVIIGTARVLGKRSS